MIYFRIAAAVALLTVASACDESTGKGDDSTPGALATDGIAAFSTCPEIPNLRQDTTQPNQPEESSPDIELSCFYAAADSRTASVSVRSSPIDAFRSQEMDSNKWDITDRPDVSPDAYSIHESNPGMAFMGCALLTPFSDGNTMQINVRPAYGEDAASMCDVAADIARAIIQS